jgi:isopentenyldiphosphate isomerase
MQGWPLVAFASLVTLVLVLLATRGGGAAEHSLVQTYRLGDVEPKHLDIIRAGVGYHPAPRCLFTRCTALPIHAVHVEGRPHGGMWLNIVSSDGMLLMLKRGPELKTCPNTWGLLGEHQAAGEEWLALAKRALREELGPEVSPIISTSSNISESPVYYYRKYADGRQDKQITYLWCVRLSELSAEVRLQPDEEVAEYKWISPSDARRWVADKPEDFCAATPTTKLDVDTTPTVVSLMNLDLDLLERYLSAHDWDTPTIKRSAIWENSLVDRNSPTGLSKRSAYDRDENPNGTSTFAISYTRTHI